MASPLSTGSEQALREDLKRYLLWMVGGVVMLDAAAMGLYYTLGIQHRTPRTQGLFVGVWTVLTLAVVLTGLGKIRSARVRARRAR
jgi:hypothetical protein